MGTILNLGWGKKGECSSNLQGPFTSFWKMHTLQRKSKDKNYISSSLYLCNSLNLCHLSFIVIMLIFHQRNFKTFFSPLDRPIKDNSAKYIIKIKNLAYFSVFLGFYSSSFVFDLLLELISNACYQELLTHLIICLLPFRLFRF